MREMIETWWPVVLPILAIAGSTIRTETQLTQQASQVARLQDEGVPHTNERLARIEVSLDTQGKQLDRIESKLDKTPQ